MGHQETYRHNEAYAEFLSGWDINFYSKYIDNLSISTTENTEVPKILDVGCGVGQVVLKLKERGFSAYGIDVSEANIARATQHSPSCTLYNGKKLPFENNFFDSVGSLNVLEHVEEPELFLQELVRVTKPQGKITVSSPNFLRVIGFRDYHPRMRGLNNKIHNALSLLKILKQIRLSPEKVSFEKMPPIVKEPFTADDDAIIVTNPLQISFFLKRCGCEIKQISCTDRYVNPLIDWILNLTPLKLMMFNGFITARKL